MHTHTYTHACTLEHTKTLSLTHTYIQPGISKCETIKIVPMIWILHDHTQSKFFARVVLQCTTVYCSVLQCVAVYCSVLQYIAVFCGAFHAFQCVAVYYSVLQFVAVCCSVLQCVTVCYSVLQRVAVLICHLRLGLTTSALPPRPTFSKVSSMVLLHCTFSSELTLQNFNLWAAAQHFDHYQ